MADLEKQPDLSEGNRNSSIHSHGPRPDHLEEIEKVHTNIDVIHATTENPYLEPNFIGTYIAIALATCAAFAGFVMPVTALALINADVGEIHRDVERKLDC